MVLSFFLFLITLPSSSFLFFLLPQVLETVNEKKGVVSVNLDLGAHHLDLFFPDDEGMIYIYTIIVNMIYYNGLLTLLSPLGSVLL